MSLIRVWIDRIVLWFVGLMLLGIGILTVSLAEQFKYRHRDKVVAQESLKASTLT